MLKLPKLNFDSQKKFTPAEMDGFRTETQTQAALAASKLAGEEKDRAMKDLMAGYQNAQTQLAQFAQFNAPERQQVGKDQGLLLMLGDALKEIVSTAPRKFRQPQTPGIQVAQGLKDQEYSRQLGDAQTAFQNQQSQLQAAQNAAMLGVEGLKAQYGMSQDEAALALDNLRYQDE